MQREKWHANREASLARSRANYAKHAAKRREESAIRKAENREYYTLAEWFRRKGIPVSHIAPSEIQMLVEMKKAIKESRI